MKGIFKYISSIVRSSLTILLLKIVGMFTFFMPKVGIRIKQLLFIMTIVNELRRLSLFTNLTIEHVNRRLLRIKNVAILDDMSDITRWGVIHLDMEQLRAHGIHIERLMSKDFNDRELYDFSKYLVEVTPPSLRYNKTVMMNDLQRLLKQDNIAHA